MSEKKTIGYPVPDASMAPASGLHDKTEPSAAGSYRDFDAEEQDYLDSLDGDEFGPDGEDGEPWDDCGLMPDGQCTKAGSEECDWDCGRLHR